MIAALLSKMYRQFLLILPVLSLSGGMALLLGGSVTQAAWVDDSRPIIAMLVWGLLVGWWLAASRWRSRFALAYTCLVGPALAVQAMAAVYPGGLAILQTPYGLLVEGMHARAVTFWLRLSGWVQTLVSGGSVRDTGLFVLLLAWLAWAAALWLMWWLMRRKSALPGILPFFFLMAVNNHLSRQPRAMLLVFGLLAILAIGYTAFGGFKANWIRRRVDYSDELGFGWGFSSGIVAAALVSAALVFSLVATPDGLQILSDLVEQSRQQMSDTANQWFGGVKPPPTPSANEKPLKPPTVVNTPNLGAIGAAIANGDDVILWAWVSDPAPLPEERGGPPHDGSDTIRHYWRGSIFSEYTGRGWNSAALAAGSPIQVENPDASAGRYVLKQRYEVVARHNGALFSVGDPVFASNDTKLRVLTGDNSHLVEGRASAYEVTSLASNVSVRDLEMASSRYPDEIRSVYLQLPAELPGRVLTVAREIGGSGTNVYQKVIKIQNYLRETYPYDPAVAPPPSGQDAVDYFLFDASGGFCTYYASAMAVMLRVEGVPARVVSGYAMGIFDPQRGMYRVPASASHAWVEVYFPGYGWIEFEPTPAYATFDYPLGLASAGGLEPNQNSPVLPPPLKKSNQLFWLFVPLGLLLALWGFYFWFRYEKRRLSEPGVLAERLYRRVQRGLGRVGLPGIPSQTPGEYEIRVMPLLEEYPQLSDILRKSTALYIQTIYSPRLPRVDDVTEGEWMWGQARGELFSYWVHTHLTRRQPG